MNNLMMGTIIYFIVLSISITYAVYNFSQKNSHIIYLFIIFVSWFFGFFTIIFLPLDVALASDETYNNEKLTTLWKTVYWTTFLLSWIILPVMLEFYNSGKITMVGRFVDSLKRNLKFYAIIGTIALIGLCLIIAIEKINIYDLPNLLISVCNTYGIIIIMILISDGLIEFPKYFWNYCNFEYRMKLLAFTYDIIEHDFFDAKNKLIKIISNVKKYKSTKNYDDHEKILIENVYEKILPYIEIIGHTEQELDFEKIEINVIVNQYKTSIDTYEINKLKINSYIKLYDYLKISSNKYLKKGLYDIIFKSMSIIFLICSIITFWCELCITIKNSGKDLSLYSIAINHSNSTIWKYIFSSSTLLYLGVALYYPLFRKKTYNIFSKLLYLPELETNHKSTIPMLLNVSIFMCRLQFSLSFNFLSMIKYTRSDVNTGYMISLGSNLVLSPFDSYTPILMIILTLMKLLKITDRIMSCFDIDYCSEPVPNNLDHENKIIQNEELLKRTKFIE